MKIKLLCILLLVLTDMIGQDIFIKHYGEWSGQGNSVVVDALGNFLLVGNKTQGGNGEQICVYKIDPTGNTFSLNLYGGATNDYANEIISTVDGGFALAGYSSTSSTVSSITLMKLQSSSSLSWTKTIGGASQETAFSIRQKPTGEYFIGGKKTTNGQNDFFLVKTDVNGDTLWTRTYGGTANEIITSIDLCSDGGIIMAGYTNSFGAGSWDYYIVKADNLGNFQWSKTFGTTLQDIANSVKQTPDGGYIIAGYKNYSSLTSDVYIIKTNSVGDTLWTRTFSAPQKLMSANDLILTQDGGYAIAGRVDAWQFIPPNIYSFLPANVLAMKVTSTGSLQGIKEYSVDTSPVGPCLTSGYGNSIIQLPDESCVVGGTFFNCMNFETMLIKTRDIGPISIKEYEIADIKIFPNPSSDKITFQLNKMPTDYSLILFDIAGSQVMTTNYLSTNQLTIDRRNLINGLYFFQLKNNSGQVYSGKIVFE